MSAQINQMSAPAEKPETQVYEDDEGYDYREVEPFYYCAYCDQDRGRDFMEQMCADCYWEWDSLNKRPGRIRRSLLDPKYASPEGQEKVYRWIKEANQELAEFADKLEAGQDRIHRELEIHEVYGVMGFGASNPYREADDEQFKEVWALNAAYDAAHPVGAGAGEPKPKTLQEMTENELHYKLIALDNERKEMRYKARDRVMTPEELEEYAAKDRATGECVNELLRRRK